VQFIQLDHRRRLLQSIQLQAMEVGGAGAGLLQEAFDSAGIDVADVGGGLDRAAVAQALDMRTTAGSGSLA
jgi:hypothetical protein